MIFIDKYLLPRTWNSSNNMFINDDKKQSSFQYVLLIKEKYPTIQIGICIH